MRNLKFLIWEKHGSRDFQNWNIWNSARFFYIIYTVLKINQTITRSWTTMNHPVEPSGWAPEGPDPPRSKIQKTIKIGNFHQYFKLMTHIVMIRSLNRCAAMKWSINICIICMRLSIFQKNSKNGDMTKIMK